MEQSLLKKYEYIGSKASWNKLDNRILSACSKNNHRYFSMYTKNNRDRIYLGNQSHPIVKEILSNYFFSHITNNLENNISEMIKLKDNYKTIDPNCLRDEFPNAYKFDDPLFFKIAGVVDENKWANEPYEKSEAHSEHLTHLASDGTLLRSKSEVVIANTLINHGLDFRYEETRTFAGITISPDFIIYSRKLHREIIWEHFGLISDPKYLNTFGNKMISYIEADYFPYINLIVTFDDKNGNIDSRLIEELVEAFF